MSSLAASRADNFYHPPDWNPEKISRDKFQKSTGHNQYTKHGIIRFELPYDGWCEGCGRHIGKGTRYNAKKEQDGKYFSTKIWKFTMTCATCPQEFVIATDPKVRPSPSPSLSLPLSLISVPVLSVPAVPVPAPHRP